MIRLPTMRTAGSKSGYRETCVAAAFGGAAVFVCRLFGGHPLSSAYGRRRWSVARCRGKKIRDGRYFPTVN